jgi:RsiW-degrading membrane proteinase PrsW (M82 family)
MKEPFLSDATQPKQPIQKQQLIHFFISLGLVIAVILGANALYTILPHGPLNALEGARMTQNVTAIEREYGRLLETDPNNLEYHRGLIDAHLATPKVQHTRHQDIVRDDTDLLGRYNGYAQSQIAKTRDIGNYGLGYYYMRTNEDEKALSYYQKVSDAALPYLNNSVGKLYLDWKKDRDKAKNYFYREIALKGNIPGAVTNLASLYWNERSLPDLEKLAQDPNFGPVVPIGLLRYLYLADGKYSNYLWCLFKTHDNYTAVSLLGSLAIALMFLIYIYFVDVFEKEKISLLITLFGLGILSVVLVTVLYDIEASYLKFTLAGEPLHRLFYFIFGVGLLEESVKALPVLAAVYLWKKWNEPVDIFVFATVSALGFACLENAGYFTHMTIGLMMSRTLTSVVMHIGMTCLAFYGLFIHRYKPDAKNPVVIFLFFGAAVLVHGLYDFFASGTLGLGIFTVLILLVIMLVFRNMVENALDQEDFSYSGPLNLTLTGYLFYGLLAILLLQFVILDIQYGPSLSLSNLGQNVLRLYMLFVILITDFGKLKIVKHKWRPLMDRKNA